MSRRVVLLVTLFASACSLLAPSEEEYFSAATAPTGNGGTGGTAGGQFPSAGTSSDGAPSGGASSGGASSGGASSGGTAGGGGAGASGGSAGTGATCGSCDDQKLCTDDSCVSGNCQHTPNCSSSGQTCVHHTDVCPPGQYITLGQLYGGGCTGYLDTLAKCACPCGSPFYTCEGSCPPGYTEASSGVHPDCEVLRRECVQ